MAETIYKQRSKQEDARSAVSQRRTGIVLKDNRAPATTQKKPNKTRIRQAVLHSQQVSTIEKSGEIAQLMKKKSDKWRTDKIDNELKAAKQVIGNTGVIADTGHHKFAKSKLKTLYPLLTDPDKNKLNIKSVKGLMSLPSNLAFGPNSAFRSDDPGNNFDETRGVSGNTTPRSAKLKFANDEFDRGKLSRINAKHGCAAGAVLGGGLGLLGYMGAGALGIAAPPLLIAAATGALLGGVGGYLYGRKKQTDSDSSKDIIVQHILQAESVHKKQGKKGLDDDLSMWKYDAVKRKFNKK